MKNFKGTIFVTLIALVISFLYAGWSGLLITMILAVLEISLSIDNAIVNARILEKMSPYWQKMFLTVGILIAVVGMRLLFPLLIVGISAQIDPISALRLALEKGSPDQVGSYGYILHQAHPRIASFGGMFLLMLALDFFFDKRAHTWLKLPEKVLQKIGHFPAANAIVSLVLLLLVSNHLSKHPYHVLLAGVLGILTYLFVSGFGSLMSHGKAATATVTNRTISTGKAGLALFLYLEVIDASFSFDGVIGAFAITSDPIVILLGLGVIGALFVRSLTVYLVRKGTLNDLVYLEHGAHWAILILAILILVSLKWQISEVITGTLGGAIIILSFVSSVLYNRKN